MRVRTRSVGLAVRLRRELFLHDAHVIPAQNTILYIHYREVRNVPLLLLLLLLVYFRFLITKVFFFLRLWRPRRIVYCSISVHYVSFLFQIFCLTFVNRCKGFPTGTLRWTAFSRPSRQRIDSSRTAFASYNAGCSGWHRFGRFGGKR